MAGEGDGVSTGNLGEDPLFRGRCKVSIVAGPPGSHESPKFDKVQSSGEKDTFQTGAVRDRRAGKGRYDLVSPIALRRLARHYENGILSGDYAPRNWEQGMPLHCYVESAIRHLMDYLEDRIRGREPKEDHLAAAAWNAFGAMHTEEMIAAGELPVGLDDILTEKAPPKSETIVSEWTSEKPESRRCTCPGDSDGNARPVGKDRTIE